MLQGCEHGARSSVCEGQTSGSVEPPRQISLPRSVESIAASTVEPIVDRVAVVVADLYKGGSARPRRVTTLKNTMNAVFQMSLSEADLDTLLNQLRARALS